MRYKIGDKVRIKREDMHGQREEWSASIMTVDQVNNDCSYYMAEDEWENQWLDSEIEGLVEDHDGCEGCVYFETEAHQLPCSICICRGTNKEYKRDMYDDGKGTFVPEAQPPQYEKYETIRIFNMSIDVMDMILRMGIIENPVRENMFQRAVDVLKEERLDQFREYVDWSAIQAKLMEEDIKHD